MGFKVDYSQADNTRIMPGEYEVIVDSWEAKTSQNGNTRIVMDYLIRKDVQQPCVGLKIKFDNFTYVENCLWRFSAAAKAAGIPDGANFEGPEHWAKTMLNRCLRVEVGEREYNGEKYPEVRRFLASKYPLTQPVQQKQQDQGGVYMPQQNNTANFSLIDNDELPF